MYPTLTEGPVERLNPEQFLEYSITMLDVANEALGLCGRPAISALSENSFEAQQIRSVLNRSIHHAIMEHEWAFNRQTYRVPRAATESWSNSTDPLDWGIEEGWTVYGKIPQGAIRILSVTGADSRKQVIGYDTDREERIWLPVKESAVNITASMDVRITDNQLPTGIVNDTDRLEFVAIAGYHLAQRIAGAILGQPGAGLQIRAAHQPVIDNILLLKKKFPARLKAANYNSTMLDVANEALGLCGRPVISSLSDASPEAEQIRPFINRSIRHALMEGEWDFNRVTSEIRETPTPVLDPLDWGIEPGWFSYEKMPDGTLRVLSVMGTENREQIRSFAIDRNMRLWLPIKQRSVKVTVSMDVGADMELPVNLENDTDRLEFVAVAGYHLAQRIAGVLTGQPGIGTEIRAVSQQIIDNILALKKKSSTRLKAALYNSTMLDVANEALGLCGRPAISSLGDTSPEAEQIRLFINRSIRHALMESEWDFNRMTYEVLENPGANVDPIDFGVENGWSLYAKMPQGTLRVLSVIDAQSREQIRGFFIDRNMRLWLPVKTRAVKVTVSMDVGADMELPVEFDNDTDRLEFVAVAGYHLAQRIAGVLTGQPGAGLEIRTISQQIIDNILAIKKKTPALLRAANYTATMLDVANEALGLCGRPVITSLNDDSPEAGQIRPFINRSIRHALMEHEWDFNRVTQEVREQPTPPLDPIDFGIKTGWFPYEKLPEGTLRVLSIISTSNREQIRSFELDKNMRLWLPVKVSSVKVTVSMDVGADMALPVNLDSDTDRLEFVSVAGYHLAQRIAGALTEQPGAGLQLRLAAEANLSRIRSHKQKLPTKMEVRINDYR